MTHITQAVGAFLRPLDGQGARAPWVSLSRRKPSRFLGARGLTCRRGTAVHMKWRPGCVPGRRVAVLLGCDSRA